MSVKQSLLNHNRRVDHACRSHWGISVMVWRALDSLVSLGALILAGYAIDQSADPTIALGIAAVIISGPKIVEWWLVHEDYIEPKDTRRTPDEE